MSEDSSPHTTGPGRANQRERTRRAILDACRELMGTGRPVTMPEVARRALVSDATAYRYFPDLATLLSAALVDDWPTPAEALRPLADSRDPVERVGLAARVLLEGVASRQNVVRVMIAATVTRAEIVSQTRPGIRFGLIDEALAPFRKQLDEARPGLAEELRQSLAIVISAEALFTLTDLCGLSVEDAVARAERTARVLTGAAFAEIPGQARLRPE
jgi:AcrR family transcriptional regulator